MAKKILFLIPSLGHGGAERVLVNLANNLDTEKFEVTVQTLFDKQAVSFTARQVYSGL